MDLISSKNGNINIYYTTVYHPTQKRFLFLITDFKIFYPKMTTKSAATVVFGRVQRVLGF